MNHPCKECLAYPICKYKQVLKCEILSSWYLETNGKYFDSRDFPNINVFVFPQELVKEKS